ncbi:ABC transporter substrate-binding protein [Desulfocicer niacini]
MMTKFRPAFSISKIKSMDRNTSVYVEVCNYQQRVWGNVLFFSMICLLMMVFFLSCRQTKSANVLTIGLPEEPRTLNVWLASDSNSWKILSQIYQAMYVRDPDNLELIPWLAKDMPVLETQTMSYLVKLKKAKWSDGTDFTAHDVAFTAGVFLDFKVPRYYSKWKAIDKIEVVDDHTVRFYLKEPSAIVLSRVFTAPMVSRAQWQTVADAALKTQKPLRTLQNHTVENPLGTGPFMLSTYRKGTFVHMKKNPWFFGTGTTIAHRRLGPWVDGVIYKMYGTSDVAILALQKGEIDMYWWGIEPGYVEDLKKSPDIELFHNAKSALYFMGFNLRKPPFDDKVLRRAIATLIDKDFIVTRLLQNYGVAMHSVVPPGNLFWHNPDVRRYSKGMNHTQRIQKACELLQQAGYTWQISPVDEAGNPREPSNICLPNGEPMEKITILTPPADYDPKRAFAGMMIQEWLREIGIPAFAKPMAFSALLDKVKGKHDFDAFVLGYGKLNLDPDYVRTFFYSKNDKPRGWNMSGYKNPVFDTLADAQRLEMDKDKRRALLLEMQQILLDDLPYIPLYNPDMLEVSSRKRFDGWVESLEGIGNLWSLCMVKPVTASGAEKP